MLISAGRITREAGETNVLSTAECDIYWRGFVYRSGFRSGKVSLGELAKVRETEIPRAAAQLKGAYFIAVKCKGSGNCYVFVDPSGLYQAYYSPRAVGTSLLELSRLEACRAGDIEPEALVELFHFGCIYENRTFFRQIHKVDPFSVISSSSSGTTEVLPKPVADISERPLFSFDALIQDFANALKDEKVSVDINGSVDSRLLAAALSYFGLPFEAASCGQPGAPEMRIAARVAQALGRPFQPTFHSAERADWDELFVLADGMFDVTKSSRHTQLQKERKQRGITLSVGDLGGDLYRDSWWVQNFPFRSSQGPQMERLYSLRLAPRPLEHYLLGDRYCLVSEWYRENVLEHLWQYAVPGNTKTYDRINYYFRLRAHAGWRVSGSPQEVKVALPYLDSESVRIGYSLPRRERSFSRFHRRKITQFSKKASCLPTTDAGMTAGSGPVAISVDFGRYLFDRCARALAKAGERVFRRSLLAQNTDDPRMRDELIQTMENQKITQLLADHRVLRSALNPRALPSRYVGPVFVLGKFFGELDADTLPASAESTSPGEAAKDSMAVETNTAGEPNAPARGTWHPSQIPFA